MIEARVECDSISKQGHRLTTFQLRYPKFIHGEFMTHRVFSRNASSSRAIPTAKYLEEVRSDALRAAPLFWGKNQSGMQAVEEMESVELECAKVAWSQAAHSAAIFAEDLYKLRAHKQIVNRVLEPFVHINVVCTATEYMNFFGIRLDKGAQPEMRALAEAMWRAYNESKPVDAMGLDDWHLPFVQDEDIDRLVAWEKAEKALGRWRGTRSQEINYVRLLAIKVSVARCARVSYTTFETGKRSTIEEDMKLYDRLVGAQPIHASPAEHQATPDLMAADERPSMTSDWPGGWVYPHEHGNFVGWRQYRKMLTGENLAPLPEGYQLNGGAS